MYRSTSPVTTGKSMSMMLLSQFGKLESVEKIATEFLASSKPCVTRVPVYARVLCAPV